MRANRVAFTARRPAAWPASIRTTVVSKRKRHGRTHDPRSREGLARGKGGVGQQQAGGLGPLPAPAMPADLGHLLAHMFLPPSVPVCPAQTKKIPAPVKGRGSNHHRCTTRYCIPTYALPLTGNPGGAYFAAKRFGPQLRSDVPACPTDTGFPPAAGSLRSSERHYCLHHHLSCVKLLYIL